MPNTHRRRGETVKLRRIGVVYMNSQLAHDNCRRIRRCERSRRPWVRDPVYDSAANGIEVGYNVTYDAACL